MKKLPKWVLANHFPAIHDFESLTVIDQTARIYGAMNTLVDEYNAFADSVNKAFESFSEEEAEARENFETDITKVYREFMCQMENYLKINLGDTATKVIIEGMNNGNIPIPTDNTLSRANYPAEAAATGELIRKNVEDLAKEISIERARINNLTANPGTSTEGNAELIDIRIDYEGNQHDTAGEAVRSATSELNNGKVNKYIDDLPVEEYILGLSKSVYRRVSSPNLMKMGDYTNTLLSESGEEVDSTTYVTTKYIPVLPKKKICYTRQRTATERMVEGAKSIVFYDGNKNVISALYGGNTILPLTAVDVPKNANYVRISMYESLSGNSHNPMLEYSDGTDILPAYVEHFDPYYENVNASESAFAGKNICVFGDSLAASGNGGTNTWIQMLADSLLCNKAYNRGICGSRVTDADSNGDPAIRYAYVDSEGDAYRRMSYEDHRMVEGYTEIDSSGCAVERANTIPTDSEIVIVLIGANDVAQTNRTYFETAYKTMLDNIYERVPDAEIYLCTMPFHKAYDMGTAESVYESFRQSIRNIGIEYGYPIIDLKAEMQVNKNNYGKFMDSDYVHYDNIEGRRRTAETVRAALLRF